jgi:hypothetical protein
MKISTKLIGTPLPSCITDRLTCMVFNLVKYSILDFRLKMWQIQPQD